MQLGPTHLIYPGATHTRSAHSLGVYHLSVRLMRSLMERGADTLVSLQKPSTLKPSRLRSFFAAALLHDIGHFPYTHALKELPLLDHELLSANLILEEPLYTLLKKAGCDPDFTALIINQEEKNEDSELAFYRSLLSGVLDPDKLDYLSRDARYCGVPYGLQDVDYIFSRITVTDGELGIDSKAISSVEAVLFAKYLMYKSVYWHRDVRSATAMVKKALFSSLSAGSIVAEDLYGLDDAGLFALLLRTEANNGELSQKVKTGTLHQALLEIPFDKNNKKHNKLLNLLTRREIESKFLAECAQKQGISIPESALIIDVPEPISFESRLWIPEEKIYFSNAKTVFSYNSEDVFTRSLRTLRLYADPVFFPPNASETEQLLEKFRLFLS